MPNVNVITQHILVTTTPKTQTWPVIITAWLPQSSCLTTGRKAGPNQKLHSAEDLPALQSFSGDERR